ncbi:MAG: ATP-binding protein [Desulfurococcales archaeon]|nr:ATP-binding protein [Desulfurococcales archaeon]
MPSGPKAIVSVTGGKGGTGKSFVATNLAVLLSERISNGLVLADLDVEAPNDHILLGVGDPLNVIEIEIFFPKIDYKKCTSCGACVKACDTGAIIMAQGRPPFVFPRLCSGCMACYYVCPEKAIARDGKRVLGYIRTYRVERNGKSFMLVSGTIREGEEHTPPAIVATKRHAMNMSRGLLLVDTGAGTGNGISAAIQYSDLVIAVTEPTPLGLHDLESILKIVSGMGYRSWVVINRHGIGPEEEHVELAKQYGVERIYRIPYSPIVPRAYSRGMPIVEYAPDDPASKALEELARDLAVELEGKLGVAGVVGA